jgi:meso-butanediol dehydrogenase/(S,S)-butanediol dehydrogenase/diacetyl reductase
LDVLVNNAATAVFGPFAQTTTQDWRKIMATDIDSVYFASREALPHLLKTKGSIINVRARSASPIEKSMIWRARRAHGKSTASSPTTTPPMSHRGLRC